MADQWDSVKSFLKKAGEDIKRTGEEVADETTRLIEQLRDPQNQEKVRAKLFDLGTWAKQTAHDAAGLAEQALRKVEDSVANATDVVSDKVRGGGQGASNPGTRSSAPKAASPRKKVSTAKTAPAKKTIGKKKKPSPKR